MLFPRSDNDQMIICAIYLKMLLKKEYHTRVRIFDDIVPIYILGKGQNAISIDDINNILKRYMK